MMLKSEEEGKSGEYNLAEQPNLPAFQVSIWSSHGVKTYIIWSHGKSGIAKQNAARHL